jgi:hypothetical protein
MVRASERSQRVDGAPEAIRIPISAMSGRSSAPGGPNRLSSRSALHAPGAPTQLRTGPAAAVFSDGSVE